MSTELHDDDHLYPGSGPCNCGAEGVIGQPLPHVETCPQHHDYVPQDERE